MRRILVAVDETQASREAARTAVEYAERLGARLTFLHVLPTRVSDDRGLGEAPEFAAFERARERGALARALLGSVAARLVSRCCKPVLVVPERQAGHAAGEDSLPG